MTMLAQLYTLRRMIDDLIAMQEAEAKVDAVAIAEIPAWLWEMHGGSAPVDIVYQVKPKPGSSRGSATNDGCPICGQKLVNRQRYCSVACKQKAYRQRVG